MGNAGKIFEGDWKQSMVRDKLWHKRINDTAMSYTESEAVFTPENPYDFLCFKTPYLFCQELKYTTQGSMSIQCTASESKKKMIKYHQIKGLAEAAQFNNVFAGLILSFCDNKSGNTCTYYLPIQNFLQFLKESKKKSITLLDVLQYRGIKVQQILLRTHYYYCVSDLLDIITSKNT